MEKTHLLNILYGIFLLIISVAPLVLLIWGVRLVRSFVKQILNDINLCFKTIVKLFIAIKAKLDLAKGKIQAAETALEPLESDIAKVETAINTIASFENQIGSLTTEAENFLNNVAIPDIDVSSIAKITYSGFKIPVIDTHVQIPTGLTLGTLKFPTLTLTPISKALNVPGLGEVNTAFTDLETIFSNITNTFTSILSPFNALQNISEDISAAVKEVSSIGVEVQDISKQIENMLGSLEKIAVLFGKKFKIYAVVLGLIIIGVYLNWCIPNIIGAFSYINGETSIITLSGVTKA